jgi:hypothetical protein
MLSWLTKKSKGWLASGMAESRCLHNVMKHLCLISLSLFLSLFFFPNWLTCSFLSFLMILGIELRASHLLGRCSTTWATPLASLFFFQWFSEEGSHCVAQSGLELSIFLPEPFYPSLRVLGLNMYHHTQLIVLSNKLSLWSNKNGH